LGVTTCNDKIVSAYNTEDFIKTFFHGHSYTANPLACAVANASFKLLTDKLCLSSIDRITARHLDFKAKMEDHKNIKNIRTLGTILAIELTNNETTSYTNSARKTIYKYFLEKDILLRPLGNIIYVLPPYVITNEELDYIYTEIKKFLDIY
jgi:adenosylmethionine-8-amino-7-oxononanoate aminotransferase